MHRKRLYKRAGWVVSLILAGWFFGGRAQAQSPGGGWPDLSVPPPEQGGGEKDAALIIGISDYEYLSDVPGAVENAREWYSYLKETRKISFVSLLTDKEAYVEPFRIQLKAAIDSVQPGGTLWIIYIGHGFPGSPTNPNSSGLLTGFNILPNPTHIIKNSLSQSELFQELSKGKQANTIVLLDACFSGMNSSGIPLLQGTGLQPVTVAPPPDKALKKSVSKTKQPSFLVMAASKEDQYAGSLPGGRRPAFSYLILGALRGWASYGDGKVSAGEAITYAEEELRYAKDRTQTPQLIGKDDFVLALGDEERPNPTRILDPMEEPGATPAPVYLTVSSTPEKADVFVDNFYKGVAPLTISVPHGENPVTIRVAKDGYQSKEESFTPNQDHETTITLRIEPKLAGPLLTPVDNTEIIRKGAISAGLGAVGLGAAITSVIFVQKRCQGGAGAFVAKSRPVFAAAAGASFGGLWQVWGGEWENKGLSWLGGSATALGTSGALLLTNLCDLSGGSFQNNDTRALFLVGAGALASSVALFIPTALGLRKEKKAKEDGPNVSVSLAPTQGGGLLSLQLTGW